MPSSERVATRMSPNAKIADEDHRDEADDQPVDLAGADPVEEPLPEQPDLRRRRDGEQRVGRHQRPAGEEPGPRAERRAGEREHRAGRVEVPREPHEPVRHEHHADRGDQERERHRPADEPRHGRAVERHRGGRRHDRERQRDRLDEAQLAPQSRFGASPAGCERSFAIRARTLLIGRSSAQCAVTIRSRRPGHAARSPDGRRSTSGSSSFSRGGNPNGDVSSHCNSTSLSTGRLKWYPWASSHAVVVEQAHRRLVLHSLGDHLHPEVVREVDDRPDDDRVVLDRTHVHHERAVGLDLDDRESLEVDERRVAGAEVVDREPLVHVAELLEHAGHGGVDQRALGELEHRKIRNRCRLKGEPKPYQRVQEGRKTLRGRPGEPA